MKKVIAVNASPRAGWNTGALVRKAAEGAELAGAEIRVIDLYDMDRFSGCVSCFGCKRAGNLGRCVYRDALSPVLEEMRSADGLILGTPNYLGEASAAFRALYERLIFPYITYKTEVDTYNDRPVPVVFIMTSNVAVEDYAKRGYDRVVDTYKELFSRHIGPVRVQVCGDTLQIQDYSPFNWTMFDPTAKRERREKVFPAEKQEAFANGEWLVRGE